MKLKIRDEIERERAVKSNETKLKAKKMVFITKNDGGTHMKALFSYS